MNRMNKRRRTFLEPLQTIFLDVFCFWGGGGRGIAFNHGIFRRLIYEDDKFCLAEFFISQKKKKKYLEGRAGF